jgi:hypothetical protein
VIHNLLDIERGRRFENRAALRRFLADREQLLMNERSLETAEIEPRFERSASAENASAGNVSTPGLVYVDLHVAVRDSWNLVPLPYAKYDQNEGFMAGLRGRDYNFLGGLRTLEFDFDYIDRDLSTSEIFSGRAYQGNIIFTAPFYGAGLEWTAGFDGLLTYNTAGPLQVNVAASLAIDIPADPITLRTELLQEYHRYEEVWTDPDVYYYRSALLFGTSLPVGFELPAAGEPVYEPELFTAANYKPGDTLSTERRGWESGFRHALTAGRVDWKGNLRAGAKLELSHSLAYNPVRARWLTELSGSYQHHSEWEWGGLSARGGFFFRDGSVRELAGEFIRGVLDRRLAGDLGFYGNIELPLHFLTLRGVGEGHISPFFDYTLVRPAGGVLDPADSLYGAGLELFGYASFARSLYARISLGYDLRALGGEFIGGVTAGEDGAADGTDASGAAGGGTPADEVVPYELYIGFGHHY